MERVPPRRKKKGSYDGGNCHKLRRLSTGSRNGTDAVLKGSDPLLKHILNMLSV